jgi:hypothetical protein
MTSTPGAARNLPNLSDFEDAGDEPDMGALLSRRPPRESSNGGSSTSATQTDPSSSTSVTTDPSATPAGESSSPAKAQKSAKPATKKGTAKTSTAAPRRQGSPASSDDESPKAPRRPAHSERSNKIRSTTVHVPAQLKDQVVAYRGTSELSNGDIVIAAIEHAHPHLGELIKPPSRAGGSLFEARAARSVRTTEGLPTPLNVRLFENDFDVLDELVSQFGAASRGHLITVALTDFFAAH